MENLQAEIKYKAELIDEIIEGFLPPEEGLAKTVTEAMNYSIHVGGKRLRPMLMMEAYKLFGGESEITKIAKSTLAPFMAAIEMIHTYSLCHDDLPAMDNDEYRRGKKSTHAQFGEAMGILAGDALLNYAFETALKSFDCAESYEANRIVSALKILADKAGIYGMIGGQVVDIESENKSVGMNTIAFIHENKTAAMIESSLMIGATLAGASYEEVKVLESVGSDVGLAFQIRDDILDVTSTAEVLGKPIGSDVKNGKTTYVSLVGLERSIEDVKAVSMRAIDNLDSLGRENEFLRELIISLTDREK